MAAPPRGKDNPFTRSLAGVIGFFVLGALVLACLGSLPWTLTAAGPDEPARFRAGALDNYLLPPSWWPLDEEKHADEIFRYERATEANAGSRPTHLFGTDKLGRDLFVRSLAGGGISIGIGLAAATLSVFIGTLYGAIAGYVGGRTDALMMRIVDILYGLPYILLVVLLAVAGDAMIDKWAAKNQELSEPTRMTLEVIILLVAIGGVSWLTMARVIRGQVLSLKNQPFMEAARAMGVPVHWQFIRHLLPNLLGPIIVYATLTVPQAILQESFLSFLGIGVKPPLPSWGNLSAAGLVELNTVKVRWWLLLFPCLLLGVTLLALNFMGEGLREAFDPKRARK